MDVDEGECAGSAVGSESIEIGEAGGTAAIGDGGGAERSLAGEGLEIFLVDGGSGGGGEVGLACVVRFIGAEEGGGPGLDERGDIGEPVGIGEGGIDDDGGDVSEGEVEGVGAFVVPIRAPDCVRATFEEARPGGLGFVVVGDAAFAFGARFDGAGWSAGAG